MEREFVPYEASLRMKAIGFDEFCFAFYQIEYTESMPTMVDDNEEYRLTGFRTCKNSEIPEHYVSAPIFSQVFRWFREKGIYGELTSDLSNNLEDKIFVYSLYSETRSYFVDRSEEYKTYEEAELACLTKLIEIVESKSE